MKEATLRTELRERYLDLSPERFEEFAKILTEAVEGPSYIQLTPFQSDRGLDLRGDIGQRFVDVRFGAQVKQYKDDIGGPSIRTFVGSLSTNSCHVGSYITSSSYRTSAYQEVEEANVPITLIDGSDLLDIMMDFEIGVDVNDSGGEEDFQPDPKFWEIFDETSGDELVPSKEIPQANKVPHLNVVLESIDKGYRYKPEIRDYMDVHTEKDWRLRQADYYAMAGAALGYVHKDTMGEFRGERMRRWGLTRAGQEYMQLLNEGGTEGARDHLVSHVREMEIVKRILPKIRDRGIVGNNELKDLFFEEVALNRTTSDRRVSTFGQWLQLLPEIRRKHVENSVAYEFLSEEERLV